MAVLAVVLQIILVIVSILLVGVILLQRNKGAGAGVTFGGAGEAVFGAEMGNILTKATIVLGSLFLVIIIALSVITSRTHKASVGSVMDGVKTRAPAEAPVASGAPAAEVSEDDAAVSVVDAEALAPAAAAEEAAAPVEVPAETPAGAPAAPAVAEEVVAVAEEAVAPVAPAEAPVAPATEAPVAPAQ